jgi:homoserine dehydrogenase
MAFPITVIKFGGSVLADESSLWQVVHEVYALVRSGRRVVAVVSALRGQTDRLLAQARRVADPPEDSGVALLAGTGESASAALLGLALDRAGVPAEVLDAAAIGLRTAGPVLDAEPASVDEAALRRALSRVPVVVVPGFAGRDAEGRVTLLGRGGSDLTAVFLAARLGAECRLVKDVAGISEADPASTPRGTPWPRRFATLSWADAARLGGKAVQPKAVRLAAQHGVELNIGAQLRPDGTRVGALPTVAEERPPAAPRPLRVVLLGCGVVGRGVLEHLLRQPERFAVLRVVVRSLERAAASGVDPALLTTSPLAAAAVDADVVVETLGGVEPALGAVRRALARGSHAVTANKALVAAHGDELHALAAESGARLLHSAAVGGAAPALEAVMRLAAGPGVASIEAVLNGTSNFVLGRLAEGVAFDEAVREAKQAGFAEADPARDLDGRDAEDKLRLLARAAFGPAERDLSVRRRGIDPVELTTLLAPPPGGAVKLIASVWRVRNTLDAAIGPEALSPDHALARVHREWNGLVVRTLDGGRHVITGKGAGRWPTAESVLADLLDLWQARFTPDSPATPALNAATRGIRP